MKGTLSRLFLVIVSSLGGLEAASDRPQQPNVLFLWTDEQAYNTMRVYGNDKIKVPHINRFSEDAVTFVRAYVTQPVCAPSRSSIMTGYWPHETEVVYNHIHLSKETKTLAERLEGTDYVTAYMGKWHLGDENFRQRGFDEWVSMEDGYTRFNSEGRDSSRKSDYWHWLVEKGYEPNNKNKNVFSREFAVSLPIEHCKPSFLEEKAVNFLERHKNEPFVLYVNYLEPHMPFSGPLNDLHDIEDIELPPNYYDPVEDNEPVYAREKQRDSRKKYLLHERASRALIQRYWGLCAQVDRSVGGILRKLDELGLSENTIVVYTSEHGDMMGAHQMVAKNVMYEEAVRVPLLIRIPWMDTPRSVFEEPVSLIDLMPTLLDALGLDVQEDLGGQSLLPNISSGEESDRDVFMVWHPNTRDRPDIRARLYSGDEGIRQPGYASNRAIVSGGWKLSLADYDRSQLFNLREDPYEFTNLFDDPAYRGVVEELTKKIHVWQESVKDPAPPMGTY